MTFQPGANLNTVAFGNRPESVEVPHYDVRDPTTTDVNFPLGKIWVNIAAGDFWGLGSQSSAGGVLSSSWIALGGGSLSLETLTGNTGGAVGPTLGNINLIGNEQATFVGNPGTSTLTLTQTTAGFPITPFVVGPAGSAGYQTIQAAITAVGAASGLIYVQPGTYTENLVFVAGSDVTIASLDRDATIISGVHTPPTSGFARFLDLTLNSATHIFSSAAPGTAQLTIESCVATCTNGFSFNVANWTGTLQSFHSVHIGTANGFITNSGGSIINVSDCTAGNGTGQTMVTTGVTTLEQVEVGCPWSPTTGTVIVAFGCSFSQTITLGGNSTGSFDNGYFSTGSAAAITMSSSGAISITNSRITSSANPVIAGAGAGSLILGGVDFTNGSQLAATLTISSADVFKAGGFQARSATNTPGASPQIVNSRVGQVAFTDVIANGAYGTLTMNNLSIAATSIINANASCVTVNSALSIVEITPGGGTVAFRIFNGGSASTAANILVNFNVLN